MINWRMGQAWWALRIDTVSRRSPANSRGRAPAVRVPPILRAADLQIPNPVPLELNPADGRQIGFERA